MKPARFLAVATGAAVLSHIHCLLFAAEPPPPLYIGPTSSAPRIVAQQPATSSSRSVPEPTPVNSAPPPSAPAERSATDLEKLVMPIALHPDPLVALILPAAVYPVEIVQAARFVRDTNNIAKVDQQPWDANVKAVAKFPELIAKMDGDLSWTVALGQAFVDQPKEVMDTIQGLRAKAHKAGTLRSSEQQVVTVTNVVVVQTNITQVVTVTNQVVQVQPSNPQVVYVPTYPPTVYYPPPAYDPVTPLVTFGVGMAMGAIIANNCDWHHGGVYWGGGGDVDIDINNDINIDRGDRPDRGDRANQRGNAASPTQQKWQPDQNRMRSSGAPSAQTREARGWGSSSQTPAQRPSTGGAGGARPSQPSAGGGARPSAQPSGGQRPGGGGGASPSAANRGAGSSSSFNRPSQSSSAFGGVNSGSSARSTSSRGAASRGGGGGYRGGGGRGGRR
jgi:hypothetical protein